MCRFIFRFFFAINFFIFLIQCLKKKKHKFIQVPPSSSSLFLSPLILSFSSSSLILSLFLFKLGYRSAVFSNDTSGCPTLGGNLKKKNSHGVWQTRYFYLNNDFLIYKKDNNSTEIKGVVDIGDIASYTSTNKGDLVLQMKGGEDFQLKCNDNKDVNKWINAIQARMDWVKHEKELMEAASTSLLNDSNNSNQSSTTSTSTQIKLGGWLMKKSPHKYGGMQERYVRLENNVLMYFKKENDPDSASLGTVHLETADWVRQYDDSPGIIFKIIFNIHNNNQNNFE